MAEVAFSSFLIDRLYAYESKRDANVNKKSRFIFIYLRMKVYCTKREKQELYCYYKDELTDIEKGIIETGSLSDIAANCSHILFIIQKLYYFHYIMYITVYKYENESLIGEQLVNEEAFSFEWEMLGDDENPIIKFAASQTEWGLFRC